MQFYWDRLPAGDRQALRSNTAPTRSSQEAPGCTHQGLSPAPRPLPMGWWGGGWWWWGVWVVMSGSPGGKEIHGTPPQLEVRGGLLWIQTFRMHPVSGGERAVSYENKIPTCNPCRQCAMSRSQVWFPAVVKCSMTFPLFFNPLSCLSSLSHP